MRCGTVMLLLALMMTPVLGTAFAQAPLGTTISSPFERDFGDIKFLDAYFGTIEQKIEVAAGNNNVPFTVVFANVGSHDITGISGQLSLPIGFSPSDSSGPILFADSDSNAVAGERFHMTFFVNVDRNTEIREYPATVKVDYSRLRESGTRTAFEEFTFRVTGDSVINMRATEPFLTSLESNEVRIEIINDGSAPVSSVDISTASGSGSESAAMITNIENVVILESSWDLGNIEPMSSKTFTATVFVPADLASTTLKIPLVISYYNTHGDRQELAKVVDFYIRGIVDLSVFNVDVIELSGSQVIVGEILNEGNENGLFGFVNLEPRGDSNIRSSSQFIDEIELDAPVPFNIPVEFDGEPRYGEHDISLTVRYKDGIRDELFLTHDATIFVPAPVVEDDGEPDLMMIMLPVAAGVTVIIAAGVYVSRRRGRSDD